MTFCFLNHHCGVFVSYDDMVFKEVTSYFEKVAGAGPSSSKLL